MKKIANIVAILLGVAFIIFGLSFFVPAIKSVLPAPAAPSSPEAGALTKAYFTAMTGTSYLAIIKVLEVIGGLLLLRACSRGWGVALIGAITFNIVLVNVLIKQVYDPVGQGGKETVQRCKSERGSCAKVQKLATSIHGDG